MPEINTKPNIRKKGFSLPEMLVYVAILSLLLIVIVSLLSGIASSQKRFRASKNIENAAIFGFDRIIREVRGAKSIETLGSSFGVNPGVLIVNTTDQIGSPKTVKFNQSSSNLEIWENGVLQGPITPKDARVTNLVFRNIATGNSQAVRVEMTIESGEGDAYKSENFYSTAILKDSY
ncbi:MAG: hypothetical protein COV07_00950 [Candidatus Vogelbacteria bacterium CG10_big_fil_rev_8_21_14_0_10_45_14]|uniref:Prepilin-type N-terminal cleavage/methylation domain-containing protein n=2 Tax=Parcubacteria group TaxID=1794811 RepID=A0A2H0K654_9BACT|nr:MAG: hypothetical protein COV95_02640 [Candidatus Zambryskibacteria bacterium CG11_big_fil_rev_8_21_14_0_20_40_24]PIR47065.1 MAG: hypothetical protein COV07_00950 [Candidatus Vogelbacteria bacterium CG10_big_fil_rev_8_21_14_0_10_45_14]PJA37000.1 MAG: hypothetical protein CO183_00530 [Candidatus Zambryskibacteria bacterium CG_4_9_14_3_um_filter_42_9]